MTYAKIKYDTNIQHHEELLEEISTWYLQPQKWSNRHFNPFFLPVNSKWLPEYMFYEFVEASFGNHFDFKIFLKKVCNFE